MSEFSVPGLIFSFSTAVVWFLIGRSFGRKAGYRDGWIAGIDYERNRKVGE